MTFLKNRLCFNSKVNKKNIFRKLFKLTAAPSLKQAIKLKSFLGLLFEQSLSTSSAHSSESAKVPSTLVCLTLTSATHE